MKKILSIVLALAMVLSLAACGTSNGESADAGNASGNASGDASGAANGKTIKVGMVTDVGGINDQSFNQTSWEGLERAGEELGIEVKYLESHSDSDYATNIDTFVDEDYDLIICVGYMLADACKDAAEANPDKKFAIIDDSTNADLDNVACLMFEQAQASYLVGYVAGLTTKTNTVGFVLGMANPTMHEFGYGYCAGVIDANKDAKILLYNANTFADASVGSTAANDMITKGADVVFQAAGGTGAGVIESCANNKIWAIGVDTDQSYLSPEYVLTSAMKRVDNASYDISKAVLEGTYEAGVHTYSLADEGVDLSPTTDNIDADVLSKVEEVKAKIISGEVKVPSTQEDFEAAYGDVYTLDDEQ